MGRSLRRAKKTRPKATQHKKKRPQIRAKTPLEISQRRPWEKLGVQPEWDRTKAVTYNFALNSVQDNPNASFGRNAKPAAAAAAEQLVDVDDVESDDDLRAAQGKMRRSGKAPVHKLTTHQQQIMQRLTDAHGDNVEAMVRDAKLNPMLLTAGKLRAMMNAYQVHGSRGRCAFRVRRKGL